MLNAVLNHLWMIRFNELFSLTLNLAIYLISGFSACLVIQTRYLIELIILGCFGFLLSTGEYHWDAF